MTFLDRSSIGCSVPGIRERLNTNGYVRIRASEFGMSDANKAAFGDIRYKSQYLPLDRTCLGGFRYRQFARLVLMSWLRTLEVCPNRWDEISANEVARYDQTSTFNPEDGGRARWFAALDRSALSNPWLREMIWFAFGHSSFSEEELRGPIQCNVHLVKLHAREGIPATASPNLIHRDGEHYTWAILIERKDVIGGENYITEPQCAGRKIEGIRPSEIKEVFTLDNPMDAYAVKDDLVAHSVEAVHVKPGCTDGIRTVLLIDFTPMRPTLMP